MMPKSSAHSPSRNTFGKIKPFKPSATHESISMKETSGKYATTPRSNTIRPEQASKQGKTGGSNQRNSTAYMTTLLSGATRMNQIH